MDQDRDVFFRISRPVESPDMLRSWVEWFQGLHIPCVITRTEEGYTLWRKGKEVGRKKSTVSSVLPRESIISSFGLSTGELDLVNDTQQRQDNNECLASSGGFENEVFGL